MNFVFLLPSIVEYVKYFFIRPYRFVIKIASYFVCVKLKKKEKKKIQKFIILFACIKNFTKDKSIGARYNSSTA